MLQWQQLGSPPKLHLVELGPGRGTLMADLLRGTLPIRAFSAALSLHMVEVSPSCCQILAGAEALANFHQETMKLKILAVRGPNGFWVQHAGWCLNADTSALKPQRHERALITGFKPLMPTCRDSTDAPE